MFTAFKELDDFSCYDDMPLPSLVTLSARACVLYSEHLLGQLESVVLPMKIARLLVETYDDTGSDCMGLKSRFLSALKDSSGTSPWVFPGNPRVFPDSTNGTTNTVFLRYDTPVDRTLMAEIKLHESRISGLMCDLKWESSESPVWASDTSDEDNYWSRSSNGRQWEPVTFSGLTKFITSERIYYLFPTNLLVHLDVRNIPEEELDLLDRFPNLEWLSITNVGVHYYWSDTSPSIDSLPLFGLKKLKHLDLQSYGQVLDAKVALTTILTEMSNLEYLDVSETNLDEGGLEGLFALRKSRPLKFIGLYNTKHNGCWLPDIPADVVSGTANADQRAAALETFRYNADLFRPWELLDSVPSWEARTNYMIQLLQSSSKNDKLCIPGLVKKVFDDGKYSNLPRRALQVLCDSLITYGCHYHPELNYEERTLLPMLLTIVPKLCVKKPSYLGRMLAYFIDCCWDCRFGGLRCSDLNALSVEDYEHLLDVQDESSVCILDILNCHLKNVVWYIESPFTEPSIYTESICLCTPRKVYNFVMLLFEKVNHSAIEDCKRLFSRIESWGCCIGCESSRETSVNEIDSSEEALYSDNENAESNERSSEYNSTSSEEEGLCSAQGRKPDEEDGIWENEGDNSGNGGCSEHENLRSAEECLKSKDEEELSGKMRKETKKKYCIVL